MEITTQPVQGALHPLVAFLMHGLQELLEKRGRWWYVETVPVLDHGVDQRPRCSMGSRRDLVPKRHQPGVFVLGAPQTVHEVEPRRGQGQDGDVLRVSA